MPITTFLQEKIRDPRVKGTPSSINYTEIFNVVFQISSSQKIAEYNLSFDPVLQENITLSFTNLSLIPDIVFDAGTSYSSPNPIVTVNGLSLTIVYDGRRHLSIKYTNTTAANIEEVIEISYQSSAYQYIKTMYIQYNSDTTNAHFSTPSIYIHGNLADDGSVSSRNLQTAAVVTDKINDLSVTTGKIANQNVTWAKLSTSLTELKTSGNQSYQPQRWKWSIS